jgi:hypothetical protein
MEDAYDFYKPNLMSEYPVVDGASSIIILTRGADVVVAFATVVCVVK